MTSVEIARWVIENFEGFKYTDDPVDTGGATKYGITLRTLQYYRRRKTGNALLVLTRKDVEMLMLEEAVACGVQVFMSEPRVAEILDWHVRLIVYDYYFHSGGPAIKALQTAVGFKQPDGIIGEMTLARVNVDMLSKDVLVAFTVLTLREEFMQDIMDRRPTQKKYMFGWWKRTTKLQRMLVS